MDTHNYIAKTKAQLNDPKHYKKLQSDPTLSIAHEINDIITYLISTGAISKETGTFLEPKYPTKNPNFLRTPKNSHKRYTLRPIVPACDSPTENLSNFIDYLSQPVMKALPSYIKDTKDFITHVLNVPTLPGNSFLVTADVVSLYTNIPHEEGTDTFINTLSENKNLLSAETPPLPTITLILEFILTHNWKFRTKFLEEL